MTKLYLITHFYNEELLLPAFISHHRDMVDGAICINHGSTDTSVEIINNFAPEWVVVNSKLNSFDAQATDEEVMEWEDTLPEGFKITLNITEFIWNVDFKERLEYYATQYRDKEAWGMRSYCLVDNHPIDPVSPKFHTHGFLSVGDMGKPIVPRHWRFVHCGKNGQYSPGRHSTSLNSMNTEDLFLLHYSFAPWPNCEERKLQIQNRIPQSDKNAGRGVQHIQTKESLKITRQNHLDVSYSLLSDPQYSKHYRARYEV